MTHRDTRVSVTSLADAATSSPARSAEQLVPHLGRERDLTADGPASGARIGAGTGQELTVVWGRTPARATPP